MTNCPAGIYIHGRGGNRGGEIRAFFQRARSLGGQRGETQRRQQQQRRLPRVSLAMASLQSSDKEGFTVPDARPVVFDPEPGSGAAARLVPPPPPLWRPALGWLCVVGIPIMTCASTEYGQYMETRMTGETSHSRCTDADS